MGKILKRILIGFFVALLIIGSAIVYIVYLVSDTYSDRDVYGEIVLLNKDDIKVGDLVPMVFVVPQEYSDLHKEMWDCYLVKDNESLDRLQYVMERIEFQEGFSAKEINELFSLSPIELNSKDIENSEYTSKMAIFTPKEPGIYIISVMGYYRSTSPNEYGKIEVEVHEK